MLQWACYLPEAKRDEIIGMDAARKTDEKKWKMQTKGRRDEGKNRLELMKNLRRKV